MVFGSYSSSTAASASANNLSKDVPLVAPPDDTVSDLSWSPVADFLAVSSWNKEVRVYEVSKDLQSQGKVAFQHEAPVFNCCWSHDGTKVVGAGADNVAKMYDLASNNPASNPIQVAAHDEPIRCCEMIVNPGNSSQSLLVTGSWDKTVKYWDLRSPTPLATVPCQDRVTAMSTRDQVLVVGTADRYFNVIKLDQPDKISETKMSNLRFQTRSLACLMSPERLMPTECFTCGSIEGRCSVMYFGKDTGRNYSFKCPRKTVDEKSRAYAINAISVHPVHGIFTTAGSDGSLNFWDAVHKSRLKGYPEVGGAITSTDFNRNGEIFSYAVGYDWAQGVGGNSPQYPNKVMLHATTSDEVERRLR